MLTGSLILLLVGNFRSLMSPAGASLAGCLESSQEGAEDLLFIAGAYSPTPRGG